MKVDWWLGLTYFQIYPAGKEKLYSEGTALLRMYRGHGGRQLLILSITQEKVMMESFR